MMTRVVRVRLARVRFVQDVCGTALGNLGNTVWDGMNNNQLPLLAFRMDSI
jgi:hypothetical protein